MMFAEQIAQLSQIFQQGMSGAAQAAGGAQQTSGQDKLVGKYFRSETFSGDQNKWDQWSFVFKRGIRSMNTNVYTAMHRVDTQEAVLNEDIDQNPEMDQRSAELYDIL